MRVACGVLLRLEEGVEVPNAARHTATVTVTVGGTNGKKQRGNLTGERTLAL